MNVNYAKFQKKFDSRTISRELPLVKGKYETKLEFQEEGVGEAMVILQNTIQTERYANNIFLREEQRRGMEGDWSPVSGICCS